MQTKLVYRHQIFYFTLRLLLILFLNINLSLVGILQFGCLDSRHMELSILSMMSFPILITVVISFVFDKFTLRPTLLDSSFNCRNIVLCVIGCCKNDVVSETKKGTFHLRVFPSLTSVRWCHTVSLYSSSSSSSCT